MINTTKTIVLPTVPNGKAIRERVALTVGLSSTLIQYINGAGSGWLNPANMLASYEEDNLLTGKILISRRTLANLMYSIQIAEISSTTYAMTI
jgi:hypothetical protein